MAEYKGILNPVPKNRGGYENYSTTEHEIGTWIDGSVLYEKTISCGALPSSPTTMSVAHGISNVDLWVEIKAITSRFNKTGLPLPLVSNTALNEGIGVVVDRTYIYITVQVNQSADINTFVTLRYTKSS